MKRRGLFFIHEIERRQLLFASVTAIVIVMPIILMVPLYFDDFGRSIKGSYEWTGDGRPFAEFIYRMLSFDSAHSTLTSPLGTLLCIPIIGFSSLLICRIFSNQKVWAGGLAAIFMFGQPYYIENLSYSYDAPLMCLAVFLAIAAAYTLVIKSSLYAFLLAIILSLGSISMYQPANTALWILVLFSILLPVPLLQSHGPLPRAPNLLLLPREHLGIRMKLFFQLLLCQLISFLVYKFVVLPNVTLEPYTKNYSAIAAFNNWPQALLSNSYSYLRLIYDQWAHSSFGQLFLVFLVVAGLSSALSSCISVQAHDVRPKWNLQLLLYLTALLISLFLVFAFSYGVGLILARPVFPPRTFIGVGAFMVSSALCATRGILLPGGLENNRHPIMKYFFDFMLLMIVSASAWACIFTSFAYANAYSSQESLNRYYVESIVQQVRHEGYGFNQLDEISIQGSSPYSPVVLNTFRTLPYLKSMIRPIRPISVDWLGHVRFKHYGFRPLKPSKPIEDAPIIVSNPTYELSVEKRRLMISFDH